MFPFRFQLEGTSPAEALSAPQQTIVSHVNSRGVPVLDLLPLFRQELQSTNKTVGDLFIDSVHLTQDGNEVAARWISNFAEQHSDMWVRPAAGSIVRSAR